jgi:hypothetical protein
MIIPKSCPVPVTAANIPPEESDDKTTYWASVTTILAVRAIYTKGIENGFFNNKNTPITIAQVGVFICFNYLIFSFLLFDTSNECTLHKVKYVTFNLLEYPIYDDVFGLQ